MRVLLKQEQSLTLPAQKFENITRIPLTSETDPI